MPSRHSPYNLPRPPKRAPAGPLPCHSPAQGLSSHDLSPSHFTLNRLAQASRVHRLRVCLPERRHRARPVRPAVSLAIYANPSRPSGQRPRHWRQSAAADRRRRQRSADSLAETAALSREQIHGPRPPTLADAFRARREPGGLNNPLQFTPHLFWVHPSAPALPGRKSQCFQYAGAWPALRPRRHDAPWR